MQMGFSFGDGKDERKPGASEDRPARTGRRRKPVDKADGVSAEPERAAAAEMIGSSGGDEPGEPAEVALVSEREGPRIFSVGELTRAVRGVLEETFGEVWVRGEVSNFRRQASGHQYFTLKDGASQLACVWFSGSSRWGRGAAVRLADGMEVQAQGELTVYEARGQYQLVVRTVQETGVGALQAKFEALKARLAAEGLFAAERKRALPRYPRRVGVVTSPTGAAVMDFLNVLTRRMPGVEVIIHPVRVQGRGAAAEIARAVGDFSVPGRMPDVDVLVVTRGGGSLEDLWEFNEEVVARAIVASRVPVVSAVGHEIDFTIADFAADLRAPTPSAAAELVVPDGAEIARRVAVLAGRMRRELAAAAGILRVRLAGLAQSALFREPGRLLRERGQRLDLAADGLLTGIERALRVRQERVRHAEVVLAARRPDRLLSLTRDRVGAAEERLVVCASRRVAEVRRHVEAQATLLAALGPTATMARGFTLTLDADGRVLKRVADVRGGQVVVTRFADGEVASRVAE